MTTAFRLEYQPLPSQARFHRVKSTFKGFSGPVGSGKTQALVMEALRLAFLNPGRTGLMAAPTYSMLRDVTVSAIEDALRANRIGFQMLKSDGVLIIKGCESRILLRSLEEYEHLRGTNLAWFGVDELTYSSEEAWKRLEARLRDPKAKVRHGFAVWTPKGRDWVYKAFLGEPSSHHGAVRARAFENTHITKAIPNFYEALRHSYDEDFYKQEVLGSYEVSSSNRVYPAYERARNVRQVAYDPRRTLFWSLDFNVDPMCSVVAQRHGDCLHVIDELVIRRASTSEACDEFANRYGRHEHGITICGDTSGNQRKTSGATDYQMVRQAMAALGVKGVSYRIPNANPPVRDRIRLVNGLLMNAAGEVRLIVSSACRELLADFSGVTYKTGTTLVDKDRDPQRTHLSDALGYLAWQEFSQRPSYGERNRPLF